MYNFELSAPLQPFKSSSQICRLTNQFHDALDKRTPVALRTEIRFFDDFTTHPANQLIALPLTTMDELKNNIPLIKKADQVIVDFFIASNDQDENESEILIARQIHKGYGIPATTHQISSISEGKQVHSAREVARDIKNVMSLKNPHMAFSTPLKLAELKYDDKQLTPFKTPAPNSL